MSIEQQRKIPTQFLEHIKSRQKSVLLNNGQEVFLSPRHAAVIRLLQTAEGPLSKEDLKPYLKVVTSGIWKLNIALRSSGYKVENVAPKGKGAQAQYVLIEIKDEPARLKEGKKTEMNSPESIKIAKKELLTNLMLVVLSHLANGLMDNLTHDPTKLLKGAHSNKNVPLACVTHDDPKKFLAESLPREFERFYNIDPKDKSLLAKEKQIAEFCRKLKENGLQFQDAIDAVFKQFDIQNPE